MKSILGMFAILFIAFSFMSFCQTTKVYQIVWTPNPVTDEVSGWSVYLEQKNFNSGFVIQDGMDYSTSLDQFYLGDVMNSGQTTEVIYEVTLPLDGKWSVAGVIAYSSEGLKSPVGASSSVKISKRPGKPTGVIIRPKP